MADTPQRGFGTDLAPSCDRCGQAGMLPVIMDKRTLKAVCAACLTDAERRRVVRGVSPFEEGD